MDHFEPKSILCGVDFSPASEVALAYAALLAQAYQARLLLLHGYHVELPAYMGEGQWAVLQAELASAGEAVRDEMRKFAEPRLGSGMVADYLALDEPPVDAVLKAVAEHQPDLIVLGSHGRGRISRFLLGSVSESVLREAEVPLLITRPPAQEKLPVARIQHLLCPVDYAPAAAGALRAAASLAERLGARLTLLHSLENGGDKEAEHERLCAWAPEQVRRHCDWEVAPVTHGPAAERIVQAAEERAVDMIVIGGRRRPFLTAGLLGATTERVVRHAPCPVLTVLSQ